jgi:ADP-ribosylglycohydrolase
MAALVREVATWLPLAPSAALARLHASGLDGDPAGPWRGISAYVLPSVAWSLYAFFRSPDDWWEAVCTAIEPGGDTDTMASIAGAIAGARLGPAALPAAPLARLTDQGAWDAEALGSVARRCAEAVAAAARPSLDSGGAGVIVAQHTLA